MTRGPLSARAWSILGEANVAELLWVMTAKTGFDLRVCAARKLFVDEVNVSATRCAHSPLPRHRQDSCARCVRRRPSGVASAQVKNLRR